jgi:hypothetical protein
MPLPVWKLQSSSPLRALKALKRPLGSPANTRLPAVVSSEATIGCSARHDHTSRPVAES